MITFCPETLEDFPGGPVVRNLPRNEGDTGVIPGWGTKIPHATEQPLSLHALGSPVTTRESAPQQKILHDATKTRPSQINIKKKRNTRGLA